MSSNNGYTNGINDTNGSSSVIGIDLLSNRGQSWLPKDNDYQGPSHVRVAGIRRNSRAGREFKSSVNRVVMNTSHQAVQKAGRINQLIIEYQWLRAAIHASLIAIRRLTVLAHTRRYRRWLVRVAAGKWALTGRLFHRVDIEGNADDSQA